MMDETRVTQSTAAAQEEWRQVARLVLRSRELDELEERELAPQGEVPYQFSAKGHELAQVLLARELTHDHDAVGVYYRSRPFMLSVGLTLEEALAAGMGRAGGPSDGRDVGVVFSLPPREGPTVLPASGDVGAQYTPVAGWAQAIQYRLQELEEAEWQGALAAVLGGDGSVAANGFWSALTIATTLQLPMLFFIEDNSYGISVSSQLQTPGGDIASNLSAFQGLNVMAGSGTDPLACRALIRQAVQELRQGAGPILLRLDVPRLSGHTYIDNQAYKSDEERRQESSRDPLIGLTELVGEDEIERLRTKAREELQEALEAARRRPQPRADVRRFVFFDEALQQVGGMAPELGLPEPNLDSEAERNGPRINLIDAIRDVLEQELAANPRALIFGEDVGVKGGVHGATRDLQARFGEARVFDTSLSEEGIIGRSIGLAMAGLLPIPEIQFRKYADPAYEQLHDLGTIRWRTAGTFGAPVVVRMPVGFSKKIGDPWHSVTDEVSFVHSLGWRVAFPSNAADAAGLLRTALRGQDPTVFFEHRALLDSSEGRRPDPGSDYKVPFGRAAQLMSGDRLTVVTWGAMVPRAAAAAEAFAGMIDLLDLRTVQPWDKAAVLESVRKTGRCLVVHEDIGTAGLGAEIQATLAEEAFLWLDAPLRRLTAPESLVPYSASLLDQVIPTSQDIHRAIQNLLEF
ncbi:MAG: thiamine pyrophosphate-dependent enzyme [Anaerolineales bacterium]